LVEPAELCEREADQDEQGTDDLDESMAGEPA
jgi:hypothetical protein